MATSRIATIATTALIGTGIGAASGALGVLASYVCMLGPLLVLPGVLFAAWNDWVVYTDAGIERLGLFIMLSIVGNAVVGAFIGAAVGLCQRVPREPGRCVKCGYDLTGNKSGLCPECGSLILPWERVDSPIHDEADERSR